MGASAARVARTAAKKFICIDHSKSSSVVPRNPCEAMIASRRGHGIMPRVKKSTTKPKKAAPRKKAAKPEAAKTAAVKRTAAKRTAAKAQSKANRATEPVKKYGKRADLGAPIDGFFAKQPPNLRAILETLRDLADEAAPEADKSIKWGMPFYTVAGAMMCALGGHKSHVNLVLAGPPGIFADPGGLLTGDGKTGRHLKLRSLDELPRDAVRGWLRAAADHARQVGG
jgi:hypothetical protein